MIGWLRFTCPGNGARSRALFTSPAFPPTFDKILIANRGEIACRIARTARKLGIKTVAVYSDADINSMFCQMCDEAYHIGESPAAKSYLDSSKILSVAARSGAQAIHPGYGFLSESAKFAEACENVGINFIGPPASAIRSMGSKSASKQIMIDANVPVVPGYHGEDQSTERLVSEANKIGYPIMIKAVLGGGGKGMRIVRQADEFVEMLDACKREAKSSFGDDNVLLERYIVRPRHIEFQVFADKHGNAVHLYERDCSAQRRHQKVLEEAPAPGMTKELRMQMGQSAIDAALSVKYVGAGTVEFIFDADTGEYYFMEMNTRLQVEHPVTEEIIRISNLSGSTDLVQLQLHVAAGFPLPFDQSQVDSAGHCIEARIYAERPIRDDAGVRFLPCSGIVKHLSPPSLAQDSNFKIRVETGFRENDEISVFYDPMIAKLVVWSTNRKSALKALANALQDYQILGLADNNVQFLKRAVQHPEFIRGQIDTNFITENAESLIPTVASPSLEIVAIAAVYICTQNATNALSPWTLGNSFRLNSAAKRTINFECDGSEDFVVVDVQQNDEKSWSIIRNSEKLTCVQFQQMPDISPYHYRCVLEDRAVVAKIVKLDNEITVFSSKGVTTLRLPVSKLGEDAQSAVSGADAPMPGKIVKILVSPNMAVEESQALIIMEAMKMEHVIRAPHAGVLDEILCSIGQFVEAGAALVSFKHQDVQPE